jgi:hypothetical protein
VKPLKNKKRIIVPTHVLQAERDRFKEEFEMRTVPLAWQLFVEWYIRVLDQAMKGEGEYSKEFMLTTEDTEKKMADCLDIGYQWVQISEAWMERKREEKGGMDNPTVDTENKIVTE